MAMVEGRVAIRDLEKQADRGLVKPTMAAANPAGAEQKPALQKRMFGLWWGKAGDEPAACPCS